MTETYLQNTLPDSLSGLLFGFEGVQDTAVLLNGPTGCKFYHSATSDNQTLRQANFDPHEYPVLWYFGQPRIPATWLDKRDYVYGSEGKLEESIAFIRERERPGLLVVVNSPGAALIGDDLSRIVGEACQDTPWICVESPGYSLDVMAGYQEACRLLLERFSEGRGIAPVAGSEASASATGGAASASAGESKASASATGGAASASVGGGVASAHSGPSVNLLGLSIFHRYWQGDLEEMKRLLGLCGIRLNCALACDCSLRELEGFRRADLNIVVDPDYGLPLAKRLEEEWGMPFVSGEGLPVGFSETERLFREVCEKLGRDPSPLIEDSERARARCYLYISRINSLTGLPKGVRYAVHGRPAQKLGYGRFLTDYLGMSEDTGDIYESDAKLIFADGNTIAALKGLHRSFVGVEIAMPSLGYLDVVPKTHLGIAGGLFLCEQVLNGMPY